MKKSMKISMKKRIIPVMILTMILALGACAKSPEDTNQATPEPSPIPTVEPDDNPWETKVGPITNSKLYSGVSELHNGDAKFFRGGIITSQGGNLCLYSKEGELIRKFGTVNSSWVDAVDEEGVIIYGNFNKQIGIVKLTDNNKLGANKIIMKTENLQIDPTIEKHGDTYYITVTEIIGNVNNADKNAANGQYIIHLYKSTDLENWEFVSDVANEHNNLEDVDLFFKDDTMYVSYEFEEVDKGNSTVMVRKSEDFGVTFGEPKQLLEMNCDHEPVGIDCTEDGFVLYYSCDKDNPGKSYMGASCFYAKYDLDFNVISVDNVIETSTKTGILWYDIADIGGRRYLLFAKDYLTTCDMVVEVEK